MMSRVRVPKRRGCARSSMVKPLPCGGPRPLAAGDANRQLITGKVMSRARLVTFTINGQPATPNANGVFGAQIPIGAQPTQV
jgi:hypothetical protein